ncbi:MAG: flagellar M-ring protein FliF [Myxococcota bacterium]|jgi:flagellar M-ring protein FliF
MAKGTGAAALDQFKTIWGGLSKGRRTLAIGILAVVMGGFAWLIASETSQNWKQVARGTSPESVKAVVESLRAQQIPVRMGDDGTIEVPAEHLDIARVEIATQSASGNVVGMEIFDEPKFGTTQFQDQVNYIRALEGELSRTITTLGPVSRARVHLVIPQKSLFVRDQKVPTASVKIAMTPGARLGRNQSAGIQWLVASAIEGMSSEQVTVIDGAGSILAGPGAGENDSGETAYTLKEEYEEMTQLRVLELLEPLVGAGKVRVNVTTDMDFSEVNETVTDIDPEKSTLRSEQTREEQSTGTERNKVGGVAGQAGNDPARVAGGQGAAPNQTQTAKKEATRTWDNSTTIRTKKMGGARVTKLNIGVIIDGDWEEGDDGENVWAPRSAEDIASITEVVRSGAGIQTDRGDQLTVVSIKFQDVPVTAELPPPAISHGIAELIKYGVALLLVLLLVFGVVRPLIKSAKPSLSKAALAKFTDPTATAGGETALAPLDDAGDALVAAAAQVVDTDEIMSSSGAAGELPAHQPETALAPHGELLRKEAVLMTTETPERAVAVIRAWLLMET